uniref:Uncharacterized protein n=1 Tax=Magallana gigas TaxID=29159 RepID=K1S6B8_MAGGI
MGTRYTCLTWPITSMCLYRDGARETRDPRCLYCSNTRVSIRWDGKKRNTHWKKDNDGPANLPG